MPIMKKKVYENFTVVDNYYIDDIECKPECMGYLTYMLRKPENWNFTFKSIMKDLGVGERNVRTNIQRLEALKYIKRERSRDENGNFIWIYYIYNKPYDLDLNKENLPYVRFGHVDGEHIQTDHIIINTNNNKFNNALLEWNNMRIMKNNKSITYEQYLNWKLSYEIDDCR